MCCWAGSWKLGHDSDAIASQLGAILPPQGIFGNVWIYFSCHNEGLLLASIG